jgi:hypothetical protein
VAWLPLYKKTRRYPTHPCAFEEREKKTREEREIEERRREEREGKRGKKKKEKKERRENVWDKIECEKFIEFCSQK